MNNTFFCTNNPTEIYTKKFEKYNSFTKLNQGLKSGIWIYFLLLIFEGALRKWVLPGLATPLLIIRDPIAIWIVIQCLRRGLLRHNLYITGMMLIGSVGIFTAIFFGHKNLLVAIYGARILLFHFPLIFIIGKIFNRNDVIRLGKFTVWLSIPLAVLVAVQFYSPQSAWVNRGVGGDVRGAGFSGAQGYFRPPATFSFITGATQFYSLVACFIMYFWFRMKSLNKYILITATICLLIVIPLSISRSLFFQVIISLIFVLIFISQKPKYIGKIFIAGGLCIAAIFFLGQTNFFNTAVDAFTNRFEDANKIEGGVKGVLGDRYFGGMISSVTNSYNLPFWGYGLGMGTNVGSMLLTGGTFFLIAEGEWGRVIGELGLLLGLSVVFIRLSLSWKIAIACYRKLRQGDMLPWILLSFGLLILPQGAWSQPTSLGFCVMVAGLMIASLRG